MPLTDSDLRSLEPRTKKYRIAAGDDLYMEVHPTAASTSSGFTATHLVAVGSRDGTRSDLMGVAQGNGPLRMRGIAWTNCVRQETTPGS